MAKSRKTRKEKIKSSQRKKVNFIATPLQMKEEEKVLKNNVKNNHDEILIVPAELIQKDLIKTVLISLIFVLFILALYYWMNHGGYELMIRWF
ncbi:hypothetical protein GYA19_00555 [Candidatus Beckwithbacteria bacterium]|nr:hypothetical protein [Candidatus Beckwithbacteria bacterium]